MGIPGTDAKQLTISLVRLDCLANTTASTCSTTPHSEYRCSRCNVGCPNKFLLIRHLTVIHKGHEHAQKRKYKRALGGIEFSEQSDFNKHLLVHQQLKLRCSKCPKVYVRKCDLSRHFHNEHGPQKYKCEDCDRLFTSLTSFMHHAVIHKPPQFSCDECDRKFFSKNGVRFHARAVHLGKTVKVLPAPAIQFSCLQCPKKFSRVAHLRSHVMNIHQPKEHKCSHCYRELATVTELNYHMLKAHSLRVKLAFNCQICQKVCKNKNTLAKHSLFHGSPTYSCDQCPLKFYLPIHIRMHTTRAHAARYSTAVKASDKRQNYRCAVCCRQFDQKGNLQIHLKIHDCKSKICPVCQQVFNSAESFRRHLLRSHPDFNNMVVCGICNRSFVSEDKYLMHRRYHEKPTMACPDCPQLFYSAVSLFHHSKVHNRQIPLKLSDYKYMSRRGSGKFGCAICSRTYSSRWMLTKHLLTHFPPAIFCSKCDFQCYSKQILRKHLRNFHTSQ